MTVTAAEQGSSLRGTAQVVIELTDVNDNPPVFPTTPITFTVSENEPEGTRVGTIVTTDLDSGVNEEVSKDL